MKSTAKEAEKEERENPKPDEDLEAVKKVICKWLSSKRREGYYKAFENDFEVIVLSLSPIPDLLIFFLIQGLTYAQSRNFLLLELMFACIGPRPQILMNLTMDDVARASKSEYGHWIPVADHKTGASGRAFVTIQDKRLWKIFM